MCLINVIIFLLYSIMCLIGLMTCLIGVFICLIGVMMCLNSTLGLYNPQLVSSYHPSFGGQTVLELPEAERRVIQGKRRQVRRS